MKTDELQARVDAAAENLDRRWVTAAQRIGAPMPAWLGIASGAGLMGGTAILSLLLPRPLRKVLLSSATPVMLSRLFK